MVELPPLVDANPGDPITSEAWNNILVALRRAYDALNQSLGTLSVTVKDAATGNPLPQALVTAMPDDTSLPTRSGEYAGADVSRFLIHQLQPGKYSVVVEAAGFGTQTTEATMDDQGNSQDLTVDMTASQVLFAVPDLFGRALVEARKAITDAGLQLIRVVDSHGASIAPADLPDEALNQAVLAQAPEAGSMVLANSPISVSISAKAEFVERVKVPDIRGLSIEEAKAKLQAAGLVLGETGSVGR